MPYEPPSGSAALEAVPLLPVYGSDPRRWPVLIAVTGGERTLAATPIIRAQGARVVSLDFGPSARTHQGRTTYFAWIEQAGETRRPTISITLPDAEAGALETALPLGIDLCELAWEAWNAGADITLHDVVAPPTGDVGRWRPIGVPGGWQEGGVTWVRTRLVAPREWRGEGLRLAMRSVSRADATYLNGIQIGRTMEREAARLYALPPDLVRWGEENELAVAVEFSTPPTSVPQFRGVAGLRGTPMQIIAGELPEACRLNTEYVPQSEAHRAPPAPLGAPKPLRKLVARGGVLYYEDGGEVALWGENIYPQSWDEYVALRELGVDPRQAVDEDLDDLAVSGIDALRIHVFDTEITDRHGNLVPNDHLDVLDYIVAGCNQRDIYLWLTPIAWWGSPCARPDALSRHTTKQAMSMWPDVWPAEASYVQQFLTHVNPYTGRRLLDEPCLALFEIMNEPWYWSYPEVMGIQPLLGETGPSDEDVEACLLGVRQAFLKSIPSEAWLLPQAFAYWRYDTLRRYIDTMIAAIRGAGATQPIAYSAFHSGYPRTDIEQAVADSRCDALTTWAYPGGLEIEPFNDNVNQLSGADNVSLDTRLASKARLVYEFDAAGLATSCYMYPALARRWRNIGVQVACQFQYDCTPLAHLNWAWETHYLNLRHTPEKWVSYLIAGEVFRRLPRGAIYETPSDNQVFGPAAVSFEHNTALLCTEDCYMQARPTAWQPLPLPKAPGRIVTVGSCPYFTYDGTGVVMFRAEGDTATLRVYPDVERLSPSRLCGTLEHPLTRLHDTEHHFAMHMESWSEARVERLEGEEWVPTGRSARGFVARPGTYRFIWRDSA